MTEEERDAVRIEVLTDILKIVKEAADAADAAEGKSGGSGALTLGIPYRQVDLYRGKIVRGANRRNAARQADQEVDAH